MTGALAWQVTKILNNKNNNGFVFVEGSSHGGSFFLLPGFSPHISVSLDSRLLHSSFPRSSSIDSTKVSKYHRNILKIDLDRGSEDKRQYLNPPWTQRKVSMVLFLMMLSSWGKDRRQKSRYKVWESHKCNEINRSVSSKR